MRSGERCSERQIIDYCRNEIIFINLKLPTHCLLVLLVKVLTVIKTCNISMSNYPSASVIRVRTIWLVIFRKSFAQIVVSCVMTRRVVPWFRTEVSEGYDASIFRTVRN